MVGRLALVLPLAGACYLSHELTPPDEPRGVDAGEVDPGPSPSDAGSADASLDGGARDAGGLDAGGLDPGADAARPDAPAPACSRGVRAVAVDATTAAGLPCPERLSAELRAVTATADGVELAVGDCALGVSGVGPDLATRLSVRPGEVVHVLWRPDGLRISRGPDGRDLVLLAGDGDPDRPPVAAPAVGTGFGGNWCGGGPDPDGCAWTLLAVRIFDPVEGEEGDAAVARPGAEASLPIGGRTFTVRAVRAQSLVCGERSRESAAWAVWTGP